MTRTSRREAFRRGHTAELLCLWHLRLRGYRILARRFRVPSGEIDLIARRGRVLAAIEVKARPSVAVASESISARQRRRVARALEHFLAMRPELAGLAPRFDVMLVTPGRLPRHVADAWRNDLP
ncbi:MAG TPA: YraN family protein [Stellaceae bacterium]|nr:YraN family protein [Stellaceae bacterium]